MGMDAPQVEDKSRMNKSILVSFLIIAVFTLPVFAGQEGVRHEAKSFKLEGFSKTGEKQWEIEGETARMVTEEIVFLKIKATSFHEGTSVILTADKGKYDRKRGQLQLEGNVEAATSDGGYLSTDKAFWSTGTEEVTTESLVTVKKDGIVIVGRGILAKTGLKTATFKKEIKVKIPPATVITCDGPFNIYYEEKKAVFNNNVKVTDQDSEMFADEITAFFNPESHGIERIVTRGNVKIIKRKTSGGDFINAPIGN